jgi:aminomuconate-semialdehyde/2-hydroxymuconate-6-semialdehyde dehydrogenase
MPNVSTIEGIRVSADHWIGGSRIPSSDMFLDVCPIDQEMLAMVARGGQKEAVAAVESAREAFKVWGAEPPEARSKVLRRIADLVESRVEELAVVETTDSGALLRSMRRSVIPRVAATFRFFAERLLELRQDDLEADGHTSRVAWKPSGVTVAITTWSAPLLLAAWRVAPALAAGNTVVLKPPECAPLTASMLADVAREAGLPDGALNVVQGIGEEVGAALVAQPHVDRIAFTGSAATGRLVAAAAGASLVPVSLELGGRPPFLVFADADLDVAIEQALHQFDEAGRACLGGTRLLVDRGVHDAFLGRFVERVSGLRQGDPRAAEADLGPLVTRERFERVVGFVERAKAEGARAVIGGEPNVELGGWYFRPTLLVDAPPGSAALAQEVLGPVLTLESFTDEDEAIAMANQTRGLAATVHTGSRDRAERVADRLVAGTVWVNCFHVRDPRAPFGGPHGSGVGRQGGGWSFDFYADLKNVYTAQWERG